MSYPIISTTSIDLRSNNIGAEGALKVNTSLTKIYLQSNNIGGEGQEALREAKEVNAGCNIQYENDRG